MLRRKFFTNWFSQKPRRRKVVEPPQTADMESLESRLLMSAANEAALAADALEAPYEFSVRFTDTNGSPVSKVDVGSQFMIVVSGTDQRPDPLGNFTAYTDVTFPTDLIDIVDGDSAITHHRTGQVRGSVDDAAGVIDDTGNLIFSLSGAPAHQDLFTIVATAKAEGIAEIGTNPADSSVAQLVMFEAAGQQGSDQRASASYQGASLQIGELTPEVSLTSLPVINDETTNTNVVLEYSGYGVSESDFGDLDLDAVRQSDGAVLSLNLASVETVKDGRDYRVTYSLDEPTAGWNFGLNGTYDVSIAALPDTVDIGESLGSFEISISVPEFFTHVEITDAQGSPLDEIQLGSTVHINIYGQDGRDLGDGNDAYLGLLSAMYDVEFSTETLDVIDVIHHFAFPFEGTISDAAGEVDGVGGLYSSSAAPGTGDRVKVVELVAVAKAIGDVNVTASPDDSPYAQFVVQVPGQRTPLNVTSQVLAGSDSATITAPLEVSVDFSSLAENVNTGLVTVSRGNALLGEDLPVQLVSSDGTELRVLDGSKTIPAGQQSITFEVETVDDRLLDGTQGVTLTATADRFSIGQTDVSVLDHETLGLSIDPPEVREDGGKFFVTLTRSDVDDLSQSFTVNLDTVAEGQLRLPGSVTFEAGSSEMQVQAEAINNDREDGDRVVTVSATADDFANSPSDQIIIVDVEHAEVVATYFDAVNDVVDDGTLVRITLVNQGTGTARDFDVSILHSDDAVAGNSDDVEALTHRVDQLGPGEAMSLELVVNLDRRTLVERFMSENDGNPGEEAMSKMVDYLMARIDQVGILGETGDAAANNANQGQGIDMDDVTAMPMDMDGDQLVAPVDVLSWINRIGSPATGDAEAYDLDFDGLVAPLDAAIVIGHNGLSVNESVIEAEITVEVQVPGPASVYQVLGGNPTTSPIEAAGLPLKAGAVLQVSATGEVSYNNPLQLADPDGFVDKFRGHSAGPTRGVANVRAPMSSLVAVFTSDALTPNAPATLDFEEIGLDYDRLAPELQQPFFVGNGRTSAESLQEIVVPDGATHLFFGTVDNALWENNSGSFAVTVTESVVEQGPHALQSLDAVFQGGLGDSL